MAERLLGTAEVARKLGVHVTTVTRWVREGILRPERTTVGGHRRFAISTVETLARRMLGRSTSSGAAA